MFDSRHFVVRQLLADKLVTEPDVRRATEHASASRGDVLESLVSLGVVTSRRLAIARAKICEYPFVDLTAFEVNIQNAKLLPRTVAERLGAFPLFVIDGTATVAMGDPLNLQALDQIRQILRTDVDPVVCDAELLKSLVARAYSLVQTEQTEDTVGGERQLTTGDEPIVAAVNQIIGAAIEVGASDIHVNPDESELLLRYRVDGILKPQQGPARSAHAAIVQRLKVLAKLDLTQNRKPQDGKFRHQHRGELVDIRLSLIPTIHGENVVMRLLRSASRLGGIDDLEMPPDIRNWYQDVVRRPHGMILVTGPTGSGKTTTLYTALRHINSPERNIITIEDPVEIRLPMIRQVQVNPEVGLTFASALRSILRQDPDVVLVGEIRDAETAKIAAQAALTGHLVFSTLHTNDAPGAIPRLKDLGVPTFAINNAILCVIAQRLARRVCDGCAVGEDPNAVAALPGASAFDPAGFRRGIGCSKCNNTGCRGRMGVYEMLRLTRQVQRLIELDAGMGELRETAAREGMRPLWVDGLLKASAGRISVNELLKLKTTLEEGPEVSTDATGSETMQAATEARAAA